MGEGTQRLLAKQVEELERELDLTYAHIRAVIANPDDGWTGWRPALEALLPESEVRREQEAREVIERLRGADNEQFHALADRLEALIQPDQEEEK